MKGELWCKLQYAGALVAGEARIRELQAQGYGRARALVRWTGKRWDFRGIHIKPPTPLDSARDPATLSQDG